MTREELIHFMEWWDKRYYPSRLQFHREKDADKYLAEHTLPPAEGAETGINKDWIFEIIDKTNDYAKQLITNHFNRHKPQPTAEGAEEFLLAQRNGNDDPITVAISKEGWIYKMIVKAMENFTTLHARRIADKMVEERDDLQKLMNDISEWSDKTFGSDQRNPAIVYHLKKEVDELITAIEKTNTLGGDPSVGVGEFGRQRTVTRVEYADCLMLLLDSAHHFGISAKELLSVTRGKLEINKTRKWGKPDENGVVEHIEKP